MDLELSTQALDGRALVTVAGEVDLETASQLGDHGLTALRDVSPQLVVDLSGVSFMDSTGLKVLLALQRRAELANGSLTLVGPVRPVRKIFSLTGLDQTFTICDTLADVPPSGRDGGLNGGAAPTA
jgi:anti-anti-sigma factor